MTDTTRLRTGLERYSAALQRHFALLAERNRELQSVWQLTRDAYRGEGADTFAQSFERADTEFRHYVEHGHAIARLLDQRIEALQRFDIPGTDVV